MNNNILPTPLSLFKKPMQSWEKTGTKAQRAKTVRSDYDRSVSVDRYENTVQDNVSRMFAEAQEVEKEKKRLNDLAAIDAAKPDVKKYQEDMKEIHRRLSDNDGHGMERLRLMAPPTWVPDKSSSTCYACARPFDWLRRKHHCRLCGYIFCGECTAQRSMLPKAFELRKPGRVCDACHDTIQPLQQELIATISLQNRENCQYDPASYHRHLNAPYKRSLSGEIRKAAYALRNCFHGQKDRSIMEKVLTNAKGLAFITVIKGGFIVAGRAGTGLVLSRLPNGEWSAPSAIGTFGMSWGAQIGGDLTDFIIVLTTQAAVDAFTGTGSVGRLGATAGISLGIGRKVEADVHLGRKGKKVSHVYTYARSKGAYAGVAFEFGGIRTRNSLNRKFYGFQASPKDLLNGTIPPPIAAKPLYDELREVYMHLESTSGGGGYANPRLDSSAGTGGSSQGAATVGAAALTFAKNNPDLAKKGATMGYNYAKENPDQAIAAYDVYAAQQQEA